MRVIITDGDRRDYRQSPPIIPSRCGTPCYMEIVKPPDKLVYTNGEAIDITGMEAVAYACDGREWGEVPNEWLTIDPDTVNISEIWTDGDGINAMLLTMLSDNIGDKPIGIGTNYTPHYQATLGSAAYAELYLTKYNSRVYVYRRSGTGMDMPLYNFITRSLTGGSTQWTQLNHWVERSGTPSEYIPESTKMPTDDIVLHPYSSGDTITVSWEYDEENIFTDTFQITIE